MKKPYVVCPACKEVYLKTTSNEYVVICGIIYEEYEKGQSNYENYTIVPSHCEGDRYSRCKVWRDSKEADWERNMVGKYSSLQQAETIRL